MIEEEPVRAERAIRWLRIGGGNCHLSLRPRQPAQHHTRRPIIERRIIHVPRENSPETRTMPNTYAAIFERDGDWYVAYCPEVPGANG